MTAELRRDWTQADILEETRRRHTGPGFFGVLHDVCEEAFSGNVAEPDDGDWEWGPDDDPSELPTNWHEFDIGELTIGQLVDFFAERNRCVSIKWHNEAGGPGAYVVIDDRKLAAEFCLRFGIDWADRDELQSRRDEDTVRASR